MQPVNILLRTHRQQNGRLINLTWQRKLHQNPVDGIIAVQGLNRAEQLLRRCLLGQPNFATVDAKVLTSLDLVTNIDLGSRVVADQNRRQARLNTLTLQRLHLQSYFLPDLFSDPRAIDDSCRHFACGLRQGNES